MSPSSSSFPSKKLLITDLKPKSGPNPASSSSTTSAPPPEKRTRDQPNLSDCHCCGRRINYTNPKDRLQPLDSVWRIVLICRTCRENFHSGKKCPYCFKETGNSGDLLTCKVCQRKIHVNCVRDYGNSTPWCYLGVGLEGFRVCVDCWVPEPLKNSVRVLGRSEVKGGLKNKGVAVDSLENVARDAKSGVEKKVKRVVKAKGSGLKRANGEKGTDCLKAGNSKILRDKSVVNSSTDKWKGISYKRSRLKNIFCDDGELGTGDDGFENERMNQPVKNDDDGFENERMNQPVENDPNIVPYKRDKGRKIWRLNNENVELEIMHLDDPRSSCSTKSGADISADSFCVVDTGLQNAIVFYRRSRFKKESQISSSYCDSHGVPDDTNLSSGSPAKSNINVILPSESCGTAYDRYQLKYSKRINGTKPSVDGGVSILPNGTCDQETVDNGEPILPNGTCDQETVDNGEPILPNGTCDQENVDNGESILPNGTCDQVTDRYSLKYAKRVKSSKSGSNFEAELQSDAFLNKIEISTAGLTLNCAAESRTVLDAS